ncbi:hypothetical protein, partial [Saccharothrix sp. ST-888]|uniref:hypothetical protein n=1 Tax=Saccharothrix sp. ST-888 TaxID=1427391 RepID=UPI0012E049AE
MGSALSGFSGEAFHAGLCADRNHEQLAEMWVRGMDIPLQGRHRPPPRREPLPPTWFNPSRVSIVISPDPPLRAAEAVIDRTLTTVPNGINQPRFDESGNAVAVGV